jgi:glyoxylase-like metal-dependent hydrolase (beta-lactamase superfamily II)
VGGNLALSLAGNAPGNDMTGPATILSHENVVARMVSGNPGEPSAPPGSTSSDSFSGEHGGKDLYFDDDGIQIIHLPKAHSDGDSVVYFRRNDVVSAGDIFVTTGYPVIDLARDGTFQGTIEGLNALLDITIPGSFEDGGTVVIPGHGRLCDEGDLVEYRDMLTIIRDRMQAMIKKGATFEQVKAAGLTRDYDPQYGAGGSGAWPTDKFVEAAYKSLTQVATKK